MNILDIIVFLIIYFFYTAIVCFPILISMMLIIISAIVIFVKGLKGKPFIAPSISLVLSKIIMVLLVLIYMSHSTYYKYNDWLILNNNIHNVQKRYGDFDYDIVVDGKAGMVGYYLPDKDGGIFWREPQDYFYYIEFDENGIVYNVYVGGPVGG